MNFSALLMAGGRGSRIDGEKPLVKVGGISMLYRVVHALRQSNNIVRIVVTSTSYSPKTSDAAQKLGLELLITPGDGYVEDLKYAVNTLTLDHVVVINSDLSFISSSIIDRVLSLYVKAEKPALTVMVPTSKLNEMGFEPTYTTRIGGQTLAPVGLNVLDGGLKGNDEAEQEVVVMTDVLPFINVNDAADIKRAEILLQSMPRLQNAIF